MLLETSVMGLSKFLKGGFDDATFTPNPADAVRTEFPAFDFEMDGVEVPEGGVEAKTNPAVGPTEEVGETVRRETVLEGVVPDPVPEDGTPGRVIGGARVPTPGDKRKHVLGVPLEGAPKRVRMSDTGPSQPMKNLKRKKKVVARFTSTDFQLAEENPPENVLPSGADDLGKTKVASPTKKVLSISSSSGSESATAPFTLGRDMAYEVDIPGLFVPPFRRVKHACLLDDPDDRTNYVRNVMVPKKLQGVSEFNDQQFMDYANHTLVESITAQVEYLRRLSLVSEHRLRLLRENSRLNRRVEEFEKDAEHIRLGKQREDLHSEIASKTRELVSLREKVKEFDSVLKEKDELQVKCDAEVKKSEDLVESLACEQTKVTELSESVSVLTAEKAGLEKSVGELTNRVAELVSEKRNLVAGFPSFVKKFLKSDEFNQEMGIVQGLAMDAGGHRAVERLRSAFGTRLNVTRLRDHKPEALAQLFAAADQLSEREYPFLVHIAMSSDLPTADILGIEPDTLPESNP